jgi:D-alanyl-D-alanine carboxypeptidase/D-alanyl-D-alanine-endopeptidase (penicillin-binding protein 4)
MEGHAMGRRVVRRGVAVLALLLAGAVAAAPAPAPDPVARVLALPRAALLLEEGGRPVITRQADQPMVPASTLKILTALAAIERWGLDHRFHTDFHRTADGWLWVKGGGDPYLVSEELDGVAQALRRLGVREVAGIGTDDGLFAPDLEIEGRSATRNPYDAPVTALAANFNTVNVVRSKDGTVRSAEPQTPLTPLARELAGRLPPGTERVNLRERDTALRYFAELLGAKLAATGVVVGSGVRSGRVPAGAERVYRHQGSRDLQAVLAGMLEHSSNFVANDLFLLLGDAGDGRPLTVAAAQRALTSWATRRFGWQGFRIEDGAGLSPGNRLSARQLVDAVKAFAPYRELLPAHGSQVRAKTGTLSNVSTYAGFVQRNGAWQPFALMINQPVPYGLRLEVADALSIRPSMAAP